MSVVKVSEITAASSDSIEDAVKKGVKRMGSTVDNLKGVWVNEIKAKLDGDKIDEWRVNMRISFVVKE